LNRFNYGVIRSLPPNLLVILLSIYNDLFAQGLFFESWRASFLTFDSKSDGKDVRSIALFSYFLKVFEKMVHRKMQWIVEVRFFIPNFQSGFKNFRSYTDNLVTFTNRIHSAFLNNAPTVAVFLDIADAFDNVIPNILIQGQRNASFPACLCKFIGNLLVERLIYAVRMEN